MKAITVKTTLLIGMTIFGNVNLLAKEVNSQKKVELSAPELEKTENFEAEKSEYISHFFESIARKGNIRGTHSKGVCAKAQVEVFSKETLRKANLPVPEDVIQNLNGFFAQPNTYNARIRFANAASKIENDLVPDPRAVSIAIDLGDSKRQDFVMQNMQIFPIPSMTDFLFVIDPLGAKLSEYEQWLTPADKQSRLARIGYMFGYLLPKNLKLVIASYLTETYWSGSAFRFGEKSAAKYSLVPCSSNMNKTHKSYENTVNKVASEVFGNYENLFSFDKGGSSGSPSELIGTFINKAGGVLVQNFNLVERQTKNYLKYNFESEINDKETPACFEFKVQPLENLTNSGLPFGHLMNSTPGGRTSLVEDPSIVWEGPSYTVAKVTIVPQSKLESSECDDPKAAINVMKYTYPENIGIGRINRGRTASEELSAKTRK